MRAHGQSPARNRNLICKQAIETNCDYVLFIDDDNLLPPDTIKRLLNHDKDIVTGLYLMRNYPHQPVIFDVANDDGTCKWHFLGEDESGLIEIVATGLGCLLIKTEVLREIAKREPYWFTLGELESDQWCDDLAFFKRVRQAGFKIFCDLNCPIGHYAKVAIWPYREKESWNLVYDTNGPSRVSLPMPEVRKLENAI